MADRRSLLLGTALASTLLLACLTAPAPALAVACTQPPPPAPIADVETTFITCINTDTRADASQVILLSTSANPGSYIHLYNSGALTSSGGIGINVQTAADDSPVTIVNAGTINAALLGIFTATVNSNSDISITNSADIVAHGGVAIQAQALGSYSDIAIINSGDLIATGSLARAIFVQAGAQHDDLSIENGGTILATATNGAAYGIFAYGGADDSSIAVDNRGDIVATGTTNATGIYSRVQAAQIAIENSATLTMTGQDSAHGILAFGINAGSDIAIDNSGHLTISSPVGDAFGIKATAHDRLAISNSGDIDVSGLTAAGISVSSGHDLALDNNANITARSSSALSNTAFGIFAEQEGAGYDLAVSNSGKISATSVYGPNGIHAETHYTGSSVQIVNAGDIVATGYEAYAIVGLTFGPNSPLSIINNGSLSVKGGPGGAGIYARTTEVGSPILIDNSGSISGIGWGIYARSETGTTIVNSGDISATSLLAIQVSGAGNAAIYNAGHITGYVLLDADDTFINEKGGVFETKLASDFGPGSDLFRNEAGGTVLAATDPNVKEHSAFINLERFENQGLISMQDKQAGDSFEISNTVGGRDLKFIGSGSSTLAVDSFLGGPGSISDTLTINGDVSGKTLVKVANTNPGLGAYNKEGIPVVYVNGATPKGNEFFLPHPIDTGFFDYDLFFGPTGSGVFELKSFLGQGAFVLPQLITAAQDMWHSGSSTWFDRTADLRVLLNGGAAPADDADAKYAEGSPGQPNITPAVWARGSGNWLNRDDSESVNAYGREYRYNLNRDLQTIDFQSGIDLGKRGLLSDNDILVFGALGGYIHSDLDYDAINRIFSFNGGQMGSYAT